MAIDPVGAAGRLAGKLSRTDWKARASKAAAAVKAEYEAGKRGDESPVAPIWGSPRDQLDSLVALFRSSAPAHTDDHDAERQDGADRTGTNGVGADDATGGTRPAAAAGAGEHADAGRVADAVGASDGSDGSGATDASDPAAESAAVVAAMRGVDWASVRAATAERTSEATRAMKSMAEHVDWARVQPVAAQVSSALIAAIATGQLGVGGRLATTVAKAVTDQGGLGQLVGTQLSAQADPAHPVPADFRPTIEAASREV